MGDMEQLQELHDAYVWEVNAAVGEGRPDLVLVLADAFLDEALHLMAEGMTTGCGRADCAICLQPSPTHDRPGRRRWRRRIRGPLPT